jgi:hypothetical protein
MRYTIVIVIISFIFLGCSKDKFSSVPKLTYVSANNTTIVKNSLLQMKLSFTDAEGDLQDTIFIQKVVPNCIGGLRTLIYQVPNFPTIKNSKGEFIITLANGNVPNYASLNLNPTCSGVNDSCYFRFAIQDKAKNKSDTIVSEQIVFLAN